ncbi:MAG: zinc ribbon domain-containing protein [Armatimonadota bacterium]
MPLYEFRCKRCGADFEALCRGSDGMRGVKCPECGGRRVSKRVSSFFAHSRGSGGAARSLGGSACSSCTATSCKGCIG